MIGRVGAFVALVLLLPLIAAIAIAIAVEDGFPILFRQKRAGRSGKEFELLKFRSMIHNASGTLITAGGDRRVTGVGAFLRRFKLDELPQLWNLVRGEMDLIGARPEVPEFVNLEDPLWRAVLAFRPGITSVATLFYRDEEKILARVPDVEGYYRNVILPDKLRLNVEYARRRNGLADLKLIVFTALFSIFPSAYSPEKVKQLFAEEA